MRWSLFLCLTVASQTAAMLCADDRSLDQQFGDQMQPFLKRHCLGCHGPEKQEGKLDLSHATSIPAIVTSLSVWEIVLQRLEAGEMPPAEAEQQPTNEERQAAVRWLRDLCAREASRNAGDPGGLRCCSKHDSSKVPLLLAGGLGGTLETGRVLDYLDQGDDHRKLCSLYLSLMDRMGVSLTHFGDAETRLAEL